MKEENIIYKRNCPKCNAELTTQNKYWNIRAIKNNTLCLSCSLVGRKFTKEHCENMSKNHANVNGDKNPFYNKKHTVESINKISIIKIGKKASEETKKKMSENQLGENNSFYNKKHSNEIKLKMRISRIEELNEKHGQVSPNYNPEACKLIENYGEENGYNFQHAENGGEYHIKELGYWVDGYDKEKNVVIEYYENRHQKNKEHDDQRKQNIIDHLGCKFIELKEWKYEK